MLLSFLFSIVMVAIIAYVIFRILGEVAKGVLIILVVVLIYWTIFHSLPTFKVPFSGEFGKVLLKSFNLSFSLKHIFYNLKILSIDKISNNNLLITIKNTGILPLSNFTVYIDGKKVDVLNTENRILFPQKTMILEVEWKGNFRNVEVKAGKAVASLRG